ncbi:hypothetical protein [Alkalicoccobacillus porphyridii]|uniref:Magnesium transporter MgtE intracellular domain-containing protein n=1 Tax=Alkalicoccobacillus porphyridii TaxID=2597270 RepID=A0A553ZY93_9BACI|nr:hypothetical protein [Alkalicoccobacillus porphyridii]TSB46412.1 hypothetical protein FN960_11440 [Alkalicoccobacillus porphyridii]
MKNEKQKGKGIQTLLAVAIPIILVLILAVVFVGPMLGFDVIDKSKNFASEVPVLSSLVDDDTEMKATETPNDLKAENNSLAVELEQTRAQLDEAVRALSEARSELETLQAEQSLQQQENEAQVVNQTSNSRNELAKTYELMSAKSAAAILNELTVDEIIIQLEDVKTETKSAILEKMDKEKAADVVRGWSETLN